NPELPPTVLWIMTAPRVFAIVLNYCSFEDTVQCVQMIRRTSYPKTSLVVTDNASPDHSGSALASFVPAFEFLQMSSDTGCAEHQSRPRASSCAGRGLYPVANPDVGLPA